MVLHALVVCFCMACNIMIQFDMVWHRIVLQEIMRGMSLQCIASILWVSDLAVWYVGPTLHCRVLRWIVWHGIAWQDIVRYCHGIVGVWPGQLCSKRSWGHRTSTSRPPPLCKLLSDVELCRLIIFKMCIFLLIWSANVWSSLFFFLALDWIFCQHWWLQRFYSEIRLSVVPLTPQIWFFFVTNMNMVAISKGEFDFSAADVVSKAVFFHQTAD